LHGDNFIDIVKRGDIVVHRKLIRFVDNGVVLDNDDAQPTPIDAVICATGIQFIIINNTCFFRVYIFFLYTSFSGYKQGVDFIDTNVVDLRIARPHNTVPLYLGMFVPEKRYESLCFVNFVQSASFLCADLQVKLSVVVVVFAQAHSFCRQDCFSM
jgi:hypothetical protein